jgi:hypothetical protein
LTPTPARAAGLPAGEIDRRDRRLSQRGAIGVVLATYLLILASPILGSFRTGTNGLVMQPVDYGSFTAMRDLAMRLGQIGGTVLILVLICQWLGIRATSRGFPGSEQCRRSPAAWTMVICVAGELMKPTSSYGRSNVRPMRRRRCRKQRPIARRCRNRRPSASSKKPLSSAWVCCTSSLLTSRAGTLR